MTPLALSPAAYKLMADALVIFHLSFVAFVLLGALLVLKWRRLIWLHIPAVIWGIYIETSHNRCPLTYWENHWRKLGGDAVYNGGFVDHYLMPILYPHEITDEAQLLIAAVIVLINGVCYGIMIFQFVRRRKQVTLAADAGTPVQ